MTRELSLAELAALAAEQEDQTEVSTGGEYEIEIPEAGKTVARFIEYIELGKHPQKPFQGKEKPPAEEVRVTFELLHPKKNIKEYEVEGVKKERGQLMSVRLKKSNSDKSKFVKLVKAMIYGRADKVHIAQCLGESFVLNITHNKVKGTDGVEKTYANIFNDAVWGIEAPFIIDPLEGTKTNIPVRDPISPLRIFLWNNPTKATWESLFIDGTREVKDADGNVTQQSKNWLQELLRNALNFKGSPLDTMLHGLDDLPGTVETPAKATEMPVEKQEAAPATSTPTGDSNAALAALGLM